MAQAYTTYTVGTNEWMNGDQGRRAEQSWLFPNELPARNLAVDNDTRLLRITSQRIGGSVAGREVGDTHTGCPSDNYYFIVSHNVAAHLKSIQNKNLAPNALRSTY